jgi:hypothetical protein
MKEIVPYRIFTLATSDAPESIMSRFRQMDKNFGGELVGYASARSFKFRRDIGWNRMPGLPVAVGKVVASTSGRTEVRVVIRLHWYVSIFCSIWFASVTFIGGVGLVQALRGGAWLPLLGIVGMMAACGLMILPTFHREAVWLESVVRKNVPNG